MNQRLCGTKSLSKYGNHPSKWISQRVEGSIKSPGVAMLLNYLRSLYLLVLWSMVRTLIFWRISGWEIIFFLFFFCICITYLPLKIVLFQIFWWDLKVLSFSFGFHRNLIDKETTEVVSFFVSHWELSFRVGRGYPISPNLGFSCKSFFKSLLDTSRASRA